MQTRTPATLSADTWQRFRRNRFALAGLVVVMLLGVAAAGAPWLYNPTLDGGTFISYVDPHAVADRARLVRQDKLRGLWAWEISNDDAAGDLTAALAAP